MRRANAYAGLGIVLIGFGVGWLVWWGLSGLAGWLFFAGFVPFVGGLLLCVEAIWLIDKQRAVQWRNAWRNEGTRRYEDCSGPEQ